MIHMKTINRILLVLLFAAMSVMASAQVLEKAANRLELCTVETEYGENSLSGEIEVFQMKDTGKYWLSVGHLGIGGDIVQLNFDPVYELFIPLGDTIDEAIETMKDIKAFYSKPRLTKMEVQGCLAAMYPSENMETVTLTSRRLLGSKIMEFSVKRDDLVRANYITKANFGSLLSSLKFYKKLHPKQK